MLDRYQVNTDGGARGNPGPAATGVVIRLNGEIIYQGGRYLGETTNNVAEYAAVIDALEWLKANLTSIKSCQIDFLLDSNLVVQQLLGNFRIREPHLQALASSAHDLMKNLPATVAFHYVPRAQNHEADAMVNAALDQQKNAG